MALHCHGRVDGRSLDALFGELFKGVERAAQLALHELDARFERGDALGLDLRREGRAAGIVDQERGELFVQVVVHRHAHSSNPPVRDCKSHKLRACAERYARVSARASGFSGWPNREMYVASNETIRMSHIVATPESCWSLLPSGEAQRALARKRQCLTPGVREARRPNTMYEHERESGLLSEHDGLGFAEPVFALSQPTLGVTPQFYSTATRVAQEYRVCSWPYLVRSHLARLAHVVIRTHALHPVDLSATSTLRLCAPCETSLRGAGVFDYSFHGLLLSEVWTPAESAHRVLNVAIGGVSLCKFPVESFIGDELHLLLIADAWVEGDAPHEVEQWLERSHTEHNYTDGEHAAYRAARDAVFDDSPTETLHASGALRLSNLRLKAVAVQPGTMDHRTKDGKRKFGLRACSKAAEVVLGSTCIGRVMERAANVESGFCKMRVGVAQFEQRDAVEDLLQKAKEGVGSAVDALVALQDTRVAEQLVACMDRGLHTERLLDALQRVLHAPDDAVRSAAAHEHTRVRTRRHPYLPWPDQQARGNETAQQVLCLMNLTPEQTQLAS